MKLSPRSNVLGACFLFVLFSLAPHLPVQACSVNQSGPMPICGHLMIDPNTQTIIINAYGSQSPTNIVMGPKENSAGVLNVIVQAGEKPLTIVISHFSATVVRFTGATGRVQKVIAMGARKDGWDHVAIEGIDNRKTVFLPVVGLDETLITKCSPPPKACIPIQYITPLTGKQWTVDNQVPVSRNTSRYPPGREIFATGTNTVVVPDGGDVGSSAPETEDFQDSWRGELERYRASVGEVVTLDPKKLLSPTNIKAVKDLPSWEGIASLIDSGSIREAGDYKTDPDLRAFSESFSARYRSRFDPNFSFEPRIDFVLETPYVRFPRDLHHSKWRSVVFLGKGKPLNYNNGQKRRDWCVFFAKERLAQPTMRSESHSLDWLRWQQMCKEDDLAPKIDRHKVDSSYLPRQHLVAALNLENHQKWQTKLCQLGEVPDDAEVIVLSTRAGKLGGKIDRTFCGIQKSLEAVGPGTLGLLKDDKRCRPSDVEVNLTRKGKFFLFVKAANSVRWNLNVTDGVELAGIATISDRRQIVTSVPDGVKFNQYVPKDRGLPKGCGNALLRADPTFGGPAILLFEMMLEQTFGRKVDELYFKGLPPIKPSEAELEGYTTFLVD